jgi:hypothetical protein
MRHAVDLHKHFVEVPVPPFATAHPINPLARQFRGKHRSKPVPPVVHRFVANLDPALMQEAFTLRSESGNRM